MDLFILLYAQALEKYMNFSKAAESLYITQPALSKQIQNLEQEIGFPIFTRTSKSVSITPAGKEFLRVSHEVTNAFSRLTKTAQHIRSSISDTITFGSSSLGSPHILPSITKFLSVFPEANFTLIETWDPELLSMVLSGELDMAFLCLPQDNSDYQDLAVWSICEEYICAVLSINNPLARNASVTLEELADQKLVFTSPASGLKALMMRCFECHNLHVKATMDIISLEARLSVVQAGAITFVMSEQYKQYQPDGYILLPIEPRIHRTLALVSSKERSKSFIIKAFVDMTIPMISTRLDTTTGSESKYF